MLAGCGGAGSAEAVGESSPDSAVLSVDTWRRQACKEASISNEDDRLLGNGVSGTAPGALPAPYPGTEDEVRGMRGDDGVITPRRMSQLMRACVLSDARDVDRSESVSLSLRVRRALRLRARATALTHNREKPNYLDECSELCASKHVANTQKHSHNLRMCKRNHSGAGKSRNSSTARHTQRIQNGRGAPDRTCNAGRSITIA